jgi:hypothetical protein
MKMSKAIEKYVTGSGHYRDAVAADLHAARWACHRVGLYDEEFTAFTKLVTRLRELAGRPIVIGA